MHFNSSLINMGIKRYSAQRGTLRFSQPWGRTDARGHHSLVMVGVDANIVVLEVKGELAELDVLEFVLVQVWPAPQAGVDDVGEAFSPGDLGGGRHRREETGLTREDVDSVGRRTE